VVITRSQRTCKGRTQRQARNYRRLRSHDPNGSARKANCSSWKTTISKQRVKRFDFQILYLVSQTKPMSVRREILIAVNAIFIVNL